MTGDGNPPLVAAFREEVRSLGYVEGQDLFIEMRLPRANTSEAAAHAAELVKMDLELVVAGSLPHALLLREANPSMPMVIATCPGMVSNGFAKTLAHPGGLYTGIDELPSGVTIKRLTLLKFAVPSLSRIALLSTTPGKGGHETQLADAQSAAPTLGVEVKPYRAASLQELQSALAAIADDGMDGLVNFQGGLSLANRRLIVDFAAKHRIAAMYQATLFAESGGLMAWAPDLPNQYRIAARLVDNILRGAKPGDLPVVHPPKYYLTINSTAARDLGITLPPKLMSQAHRVVS